MILKLPVKMWKTFLKLITNPNYEFLVPLVTNQQSLSLKRI